MTVDWLGSAIEQRRPFRLGELHVSFDGGDAIIAVPGGVPPLDIPGDAESLREWARIDVRGRYRPLTGAIGLRRGWRTRLPVSSLAEALDAIYPLARRHVALAASGSLRVVPAVDVLGRQSGRYEAVRRITPGRATVAREELCGSCVRTPFWSESPVPPPEGAIPCPEPCSVFVALARALVVLDEIPGPAEPDEAVQFAAFEEPGNPARERCLTRLRETRQGQARS